MQTTKTYIIIGTSAAGLSTANTLRQLDPVARIICISAQAELPYNTCWLTDYLANDKTYEQLFLATHESLAAKNIELMLATRVVSINRHAQTVTLDSSESLSYDALFIGTGTRARILEIPGINDFTGVFTLHHLGDVQGMLDYAIKNNARSALVIGAGLTGIETADALADRGFSVAVVDSAPHILSSMFDAQGAKRVEQMLTNKGITLYMGQQIQEILGADGTVHALKLANGSTITASIVVVAAGVTPNSELAQECGLATHNGGIMVNNTQCSSDPHIYAGGDVALVHNLVTGNSILSCLWSEAIQQGRVAAHNMAGIPQTFPGVARITSSTLAGVKIASGGSIATWTGDIMVREGEGFYHCYALENGRLRGFSMIGAVTDLPKLRALLVSGEPVEQGTTEPFDS